MRIQTDGHHVASRHQHTPCLGEKPDLVLEVMKGIDTENTLERLVGPGEMLSPSMRECGAWCLGTGIGQHVSRGVHTCRANPTIEQPEPMTSAAPDFEHTPGQIRAEEDHQCILHA